MLSGSPPKAAAWLVSDYEDDVWRVESAKRDPIPIYFNGVLSDGTTLSSSTNEHLKETIKRVVFEVREGPMATSEAAEVQVAVARNLYILVDWMRISNFYYFSDLTVDDFARHLEDRASGIEKCLCLPERVARVLERYEEKPQELPPPTELLLEAGIGIAPTRMPQSIALIDEFRRRHLSGQKRVRAARPRNEKDSLSESTLHSIAVDVQRLWTFGSRLECDRASVDPFPDGIGEIVRSLGRKAGRTATVPDRQGMQLLSAACFWVLNIGAKIINANEEYDAGRISSANGLIERHDFFPAELSFGKASPPGTVTLRKAYRGHLPVACLIVGCGFTGRRTGEILRIVEGAIRGSREDGWWIVTPILKTLKRSDATPCPDIVVAAVELLARWSCGARALSGSKKLFQSPGYKGRAAEFHPELHLNDFAQFVGVEPLPDGTHWNFAPHQFRRLFVIIYVWRYDGDVSAMSHHLRHFNWAMTYRYAQDAELNQMLREEHRNFTVQKIRSIVSDETTPGGIFGKRLKQLIDRMRRTVQIAGDSNIETKLEKLAEEGGIVLRATPWSYCGCRNTTIARRRAKCLDREWKGGRITHDGFPDPEGSSEITCAGCWHGMIDELRRPYWENEIAKLDSVLSTDKLSPIMRAAALKRRTLLQAGLAQIPKKNG